MKCQDRDCKREAEGPPVLVQAERVEIEVALCAPHAAILRDELSMSVAERRELVAWRRDGFMP
jgi:hypothetical protein